MNSNKRINRLMEDLKDKKQRDAFVSSHINTGIPFQIRALRDQRGWSQNELGEQIPEKAMTQENISRLEDPNYSKFTLTTLKRLASAFDVALMVRFVPFSELINWEINLSTESLIVTSFPEESYFQAEKIEIDTDTEQFVPIPEHATPDNVLFFRDDLLKKAQLAANQEAAFAVAEAVR
jgi:transcriptional regulator with XRE-family HTH domain